MLNIQLATKYARAIFELANDDNKLDNYASDLNQVQADLFSLPDAVKFFQNPLVPHQSKKDLLNKAFKDNVSDTVMNFLLLLVDKNRIAIFPDIFAIFSNLKNSANGVLVADVLTAFPLSKTLENQLIKKLSSVTGNKILIRKHENKNILGGMIVNIGDKRMEGSAAGKLRKIKKT